MNSEPGNLPFDFDALAPELFQRARERYAKQIEKMAENIGRAESIKHRLAEESFPSAIQVGMVRDGERAVRENVGIIGDVRADIRRHLASNHNANFEVDQIFYAVYDEAKKQAAHYFNKEMEKKGGNGDGTPWMWIVAGPNGAGKSTFVNSEYAKLAGNLPLVNPDVLAFEMNPDDVQSVAARAGEAAVNLMHHYVDQGRSFIVETTGAGNMQRNLAKEAKDKGWKVGVVFVINESPDQSVERVAHRVSKGGHHVPEEDIRRRWARSIEKMPSYMGLADHAVVIDNTTDQFLLAVSGSREGLYPVREEFGGAAVEALKEAGMIKSLRGYWHEVAEKKGMLDDPEIKAYLGR